MDWRISGHQCTCRGVCQITSTDKRHYAERPSYSQRRNDGDSKNEFQAWHAMRQNAVIGQALYSKRIVSVLMNADSRFVGAIKKLPHYISGE